MNLELAELYETAADYIEVHGWARGTFRNPDTGQVCAGGALSAVTPNNQLYCDAIADLGDLLPLRSITLWNDEVVKDKYEVLDAFRDRAKTLRNEVSA